jgi:hypothetical protein
MRLFIFISITVFLLNNMICSQSFKIVKIFDTNLFKLDNGETVKLYGLYIPSKSDTNEALANLANQIFEWEEGYLLDKTFRLEYIKREIKGISEVNLFKSYALSEENLGNTFIRNGYASLISGIDKTYYTQLQPYQERAQKEGVGIWKLGVFSFQNTDTGIIADTIQVIKRYEQPYLPLLSVSAVLLALTWDSFASASDIQKSIDSFKSIDSDFDSSELESSKGRKQIIGITCLVAAVITTIFAFKSVEVKTDLNSISMSYRF